MVWNRQAISFIPPNIAEQEVDYLPGGFLPRLCHLPLVNSEQTPQCVGSTTNWSWLAQSSQYYFYSPAIVKNEDPPWNIGEQAPLHPESELPSKTAKEASVDWNWKKPQARLVANASLLAISSTF